MKKLLILLAFLAFLPLVTASHAEELVDAYKKEYAFLKAQKNEMSQRLITEEKQQKTELQQAEQKVQKLLNETVILAKQQKNIEDDIEQARERLRDTTSNKEIIGSVVTQASAGLREYGIPLDAQADSPIAGMQQAFQEAARLYKEFSSIQVAEGAFFLPNGAQISGEIVRVGGIAAYGISTKAAGAMVPAGNGEYKLLGSPGSEDDARALYGNQHPASLDIFVYENLDKEVEIQKQKNLRDTVESGGFIGYIILGLGAFGGLLLLVRFFFLFRAGSNVKMITRIVYDKLQTGSGEEAYDAIQKYKGSIARVIRATLRNITRDREHIEDIITENILNENRSLDRFSNFILVVAAVSPLLGLLGTVTGMIQTFDIITVYGTGDPKLLSGGISEALVTTMLGLIIAIPLLLLGNLSRGWADNIKDDMEQSALHVVNLFEKYQKND